MTAHIASIVYSPLTLATAKPADHYARLALQSAELAPGKGIVGDRKGVSRKRQLNVMSAETLERLGVEGFQTGPGELGEQLVVRGLPVDDLRPGQQIRLGESAVIEVVMPRTCCDRFETIQGRPKEVVEGRLGVMARVITGGAIRVGDPVELQ